MTRPTAAAVSRVATFGWLGCIAACSALLSAAPAVSRVAAVPLVSRSAPPAVSRAAAQASSQTAPLAVAAARGHAALRGIGTGAAVAALGEFTLDGHQAVAFGDPSASRGRGAVTILLDVPFPSSGRPSLPYGAGGDIRIVGEAPGERFGFALAGGYDVNGDGFPDLIVGAPDASPFGRRHAGAVWVIFGVPAPGVVELSKLREDQGYEIAGAAAGEHLGAAVAIDRDFSGDGHEDMILGAPGAQGGRGAVYGIDSVLRSGTLDLRHLPASRGFAVTGAPTGAQLGASVAGGGFQNGDAYAELIAGAPGPKRGRGAAYVIYGRPAGSPSIRLGAPGTGYEVLGANPEDHAGAAVAPIGDINHDGAEDFAVGAPNAWVRGRGRPGTVLIVLGGRHAGVVAPAFTIEGVHNGDRTGATLAGGIGSPETPPGLAIGAPGASFSARSAGAVYVLGASGLHADVDLYRLGGANYRVDGARADDHAGSAASALPSGRFGALIGAPGAGLRGAGVFLVLRR